MQRFPAIESVIQKPLDGDLTEDDLRRLVSAQLREGDQLDYKGKTWETTREIAKDVAAFANHQGGVIIIGIEDDDSIPKALTPDDLGDHEELRIRSAAADLTHPSVPFECKHVPAADGVGSYMLVVVSRSSLAPHAVARPSSDQLSFPMRDGNRTRYLAEPELAARYRDRARSATAQRDAVDLIETDTLGWLEPSYPWLIVSLVPDTPGDCAIRIGTAREWREWFGSVHADLAAAQPYALGFDLTPQVGLRRVMLRGYFDEPMDRSKGTHIELHTNGAGSAAVPVALRRRDAEQWRLWDDRLAGHLLLLLGALSRHATEHASVSGDALVKASIVNAGWTREDPPANSIELCCSWSVEASFEPRVSGSRSLFAVRPSVHALNVAAMATPSPTLVSSAAIVMTDLVQEFGVPEPLQFDLDGRIHTSYFSGHGDVRTAVEAWTQRHRLEAVTDH